MTVERTSSRTQDKERDKHVFVVFSKFISTNWPWLVVIVVLGQFWFLITVHVNDFNLNTPALSIIGNGNSNSKILASQELNPLSIPYGEAVNLPALRAEAENVDHTRGIYGGAGDKKHLGGFVDFDLYGVSPAVWRHMLQVYGIHSVLDVGCGRGISTAWFHLHKCSPVICVEGSHDAISKSIYKSIQPQSLVEHDFSRGPWWPNATFDAVWSVEFLEHVGRNYLSNYIAAFRKAALVFVTSSVNDGWHHVEVHSDEWWIRKFESLGFKYDQKLTEDIRRIAVEESNWPESDPRTVAFDGQKYKGLHIMSTMKVFINPVVAALPKHSHLFPEHGCFPAGKVCGTGNNGELESPLPQLFWPLEPTVEQDEAWATLMREQK